MKLFFISSYPLCLVTQSCLTLCDPIHCSLPGSSVHGDTPGKNIGVGCHALLQGIFPVQDSNPGLPHCRQTLYCLSHQNLEPSKWKRMSYAAMNSCHQRCARTITKERTEDSRNNGAWAPRPYTQVILCKKTLGKFYKDTLLKRSI